MNNYTPPKLQEKSFTCPHCETFAVQNWSSALKDFDAVLEELLSLLKGYSYRMLGDNAHEKTIKFIDIIKNNKNEYFPKNKKDFQYSHCSKCEDYTIWRRNKMIYPLKSGLPDPNKDMPDEVKKFYNEARNVSILSLRGSIILLGVALEKLCDYFGEKTGKLYEKINNLKNKGLSGELTEQLHILRIFRNEAGAHFGEINLEGQNEKDILLALFEIINFIINSTISYPRTIKELKAKLPKNKIKNIKNSNNK